MCLLGNHGMLGFIDGTFTSPEEEKNGDSETKAKDQWKRSDTLIKGWIFGSVSQEVMISNELVGLDSACAVWDKLDKAYSTLPIDLRDEEMAKYVPLHRALLKGDWVKAQEIFNNDKDALTVKLVETGETALHIAIFRSKNTGLVKNLLEEINEESLLTLLDSNKLNVVHHAAAVGNTDGARMVVEKNPSLLFMLDVDGYLPIHRAIVSSHIKTFEYLVGASKEYIQHSNGVGYQSPFEGKVGVRLINLVIDARLFDVASKLIQEFPDMARGSDVNGDSALSYITDLPDAYLSGAGYNFYQRFVYSHLPAENNDLHDSEMNHDIENQESYKTKFITMCQRFGFIRVPHIKHLHEDRVKHNAAITLLKFICKEVGKKGGFRDLSKYYGDAFILAVQNDTPEAVEAIDECFPTAIWMTNKDNYSISQIAITKRCEKVYNFLVNKLEDKHIHKRTVDNNRNNLLHLAGKLAPMDKLNRVSGAALQMQREIQWFQEVKKFMIPTAVEETNAEEETPMTVFRIEHKQLRKEGEEWMKKAADSYTITTALIITIAFAAAITVPGGSSGNTGKAIYTKKASFIIFAVSDAISFFTSTTSLLLFLSILTARHREEDFLYRIPKRLIFGLGMLFLSVTFMIIAFSATLYLQFEGGKARILIPIATLTCLPIASFVTLQFPLLVELINSTYCTGIFAKQKGP
ncbi:hypothetical protein OSB04_012946 [Centaurea solstitialis]|uniref:PGG domain-containing protein n=1 Tax=Centaurea solstitialis TaxID=347529 RepID=A0AA38WF19_9ASTR|nr:hypothetical protein OSB04_012946 [Centaurea solstitialis]